MRAVLSAGFRKLLVLGKETAQAFRASRVTQFAQCLRFYLTYAFSRDVKLFAYFFERVIRVHVYAEPHAQDFGFPRCQAT